MSDSERPDPLAPATDGPGSEALADARADARAEAESGGRAVPILLAVAAVAAAIVTARASLVGGDATSAWVDSVGDEQRRGALLQEEVRYTYGSEAAVGFMVLIAEVRASELRTMAQGQPPAVAARLEAEAGIQQAVVDLVSADAPLLSDARYRLPSGSLDVQRRLADERAAEPSVLAIDPLATLRRGDVEAEHSVRLMVATIAIAAAFLFGALGQAFRRRRRPLLLLGWLALLAGGAWALAIELGVPGLSA